MSQNPIYRKTAKGQEEIATRIHRLPARQRSLLVMIDGKATADELAGKGQMLGDVLEHLGHLVAEGFIEAIGGGEVMSSSVPGGATAQPAASADTVTDAMRFACRALVDILGPNADSLTLKLEKCAEMAELREALQSSREVVQAFAGARRANEFWTNVTARLPQT